MILQDGQTYFIEVIAGMHEGVKCEAMYYEGFNWFEGIEPNDITVIFDCVKVLNIGTEDLQEIDIANIEEAGISYNLQVPNKCIFEYLDENGLWRPLTPSKSLYALALEQVPTRRIKIA